MKKDLKMAMRYKNRGKLSTDADPQKLREIA
jgi:hypothetical protein